MVEECAGSLPNEWRSVNQGIAIFSLEKKYNFPDLQK